MIRLPGIGYYVPCMYTKGFTFAILEIDESV